MNARGRSVTGGYQEQRPNSAFYALHAAADARMILMETFAAPRVAARA